MSEIEELKAENERLKEDYIKLSQQKDLDNARWKKRCTDLHIEDKAKADKYWLALQEIKNIAENSCSMADEDFCHRNSCATCKLVYSADAIKLILQKITKVEEE